jgi:hypothetical protein
MNIKSAVVVAVSMAMLGAVSVSSASADEWDKLTYLTFSKDVALPGKVLPAGTYTFRLSDPQSDRHIVRVFNRTGTQLITTLLTATYHRPWPSDDTLITFAESARDVAPRITRWFYPGDIDGHEFIYPKSVPATR